METEQIINSLLDRAARSPDLSAGRIMKQAAKRLQELESNQRWIPVTEYLPKLHTDDYEEPDGSRMQFEVSEDQWVITASGFQTKARYETGPVFQGWVGDYGNTVRDVTHWRPMPEPPKEGQG